MNETRDAATSGRAGERRQGRLGGGRDGRDDRDGRNGRNGRDGYDDHDGRNGRDDHHRRNDHVGHERGNGRPDAAADGTTASAGRLRLWLLVTALSVGGAERTLVDLANRLDPDRYDVTVWTMFDRNPLAADLDPSIPLRTLGSPGRTRSDRGDFVEAPAPADYLRVPLRFLRAVRRERPDAIQSFLFYDNTLARLAKLASPSTTVITGVRGMQHIASPVVRAVDRLTTRLSDRIVSNSRAGAAHARARGARPGRVDVVYTGRDLAAYADADPAPLREAFGIPDDAPLVGTVGRLVERKGGYDLLAAWPRVRAAHPDARLVFVGDGVERDGLAARAEALGVADAVTFAGTRDDVPAVLAALDCFVFPSHYEGLPGALLEAMAAGLPVVATDVEGSDELVTDGETGLLVPARDPEALADALVATLAAPDVAAARGRAARDRAFSTFAVDAMVGNFERVYDAVPVRDRR